MQSLMSSTHHGMAIKSSSTRGFKMATALILIFVGPFLLAWGLYQSGLAEKLPSTVNGELLKTPIPFAELPLTVTQQTEIQQALKNVPWLMISLEAAVCEQPCLGRQQLLRNIKEALGKSKDQLQILNFNPQSKEALLQETGVWVIDKQGYLVLRYAPEWVGSSVLKDLRRLLRSSAYG
jgi:hypothetical protein